MTEHKIGGILLAAGGSTRLGEPKQLVVYKNSTLIRRATKALLGARCSPVVVVVGDDARSATELEGLGVRICKNEEWRSGMGSSLKAGLKLLMKDAPELDAAIIALSDQPFVTADDIKSLTREFRRSSSDIVAAEYGATRGVPALFSRAIFTSLSDISDKNGARDLIRSGTFSVSGVPMPDAIRDIDTPQDLQKLRST